VTKQNLFIWCDSPNVATGFGMVAKNLFSELYKEYNVFILGINFYGMERYDTTKYFIYSVDQSDPMGVNRFTKVLQDVRPDKILLFQDIFNMQHVLPMIKEHFPKAPILAYFPIDGKPVNQYWRPAFDTPNKLVTYTQWGINAIHETFPHLKNKNIEYLYHGVDPVIFYIRPSVERKRFKEEAKWNDKFLVLSNNRFQPRKALPLTLRAMALFIKGCKVCKCGNTYLSSKTVCDLNGCPDTDVIATHPPHEDAMIYLHAAVFEKIMGPGAANSLGSAAVNAGFVNEDIPKHVALFSGNAYEKPYTDQQISILYNIADVNVSTSLGEGVGLSLIEAAACGTTSIAPNNSAIPEMLGNTGHVIPNAAHISLSLDNNHVRPVVNIGKMVEALIIEYDKWITNGRKKVVNHEAAKRAEELFKWEDKRAKVSEWLKQL
jgi:glycosyltransferase involved in cell wall biosynthesis